jgi:hypothetical protein
LFQHTAKKRAMKPNAEVEVKFHSFFFSVFQRRDRSASCAGHFIPGGSEPHTLLIGIGAVLIVGLDGVDKTKISISPNIQYVGY